MDEIVREVTLLRGETEARGHIRAYEEGADVYRVEVEVAGRLVVGRGSDYFEALIGARRSLEAEGLLLCLVGAEKDVWPSAMARSMAGGAKAYRMTPGKQALMADLVDIFAESARPVRIQEQEAFRDAWFNSLGS